MTSQDNSFSEFLDDYFAESEEHLGSIRRHLLVMEGFVNRDRIDPHVVGELFRALHSLKGLSGMVGVHEAEQVVHAMEDALRDVKRAGAGPTERVMEAFASGTRIIEQVIAALRDRKPPPDIAAVLSHFASVVAPQSCLWDFQFTPSAELSARGINVTSTRSRLQEIGQVLNATPHIIEGGQLTFAFIVASDVDESRFSKWQSDGLTAARRTPTGDVSAAAEGEQETARDTSPSNLVRVDMNRLDHLMTLVGDLVVRRGHVEESLRQLEAILPASAWRDLQEANLRLQRDLRDLREGIMHIRMVPVAQIFERMHFVIRGLSREKGKDVRLELTGQDTEIDKVLVERMMDPLLHMVRNAVTHGLETAEERIAAGKTAEGHLRLSASTEADNVFIELEDDGRGINVEQVANRSRTLGSPDVNTSDNSSVLQLLCAPGFSTREEADLGAGRGIGMTIVKAAINGLGGALTMDTRPGKGTRFIIRLPLTLAIMQVLVVYIDDQPFAVPRAAVQEVLRVEKSAVSMRDGREVTPYGDGVLPILDLRRFFRISGESKEVFHVFVTDSDFGRVGIAVDRIQGLREIVVRRVEDSLVRVQGIAGATDLGDGRPVLILGVAAIVETAMASPVAG
jgi:two-component system, chemotaxis family, sensor kinase CheA